MGKKVPAHLHQHAIFHEAYGKLAEALEALDQLDPEDTFEEREAVREAMDKLHRRCAQQEEEDGL
jgi:hypothetical protein